MTTRPIVLFAAVASSLHLERARRTSELAFLALKEEGVELRGSPEPALEAEELLRVLSGQADVRVVFVASGGTSRLMSEALQGLEVVLWAHPGDNSLPSALSAREKLRASGGWRGEVAFSRPDSLPKGLRAEIKAARAARELRNMEILAICGREVAERLASSLEAVLGKGKPVMRQMSPARLTGLLKARAKQLSLSDAMAILKGITGEEATRELEEGLVKSVQMALLLEQEVSKLSSLPVVTFDCFSMIEELGLAPCVTVGLLLEHGITAVCEADPAALLLMAACRVLADTPAWMANLARFDREAGTITLAHCTACPSLAASWPYRGTFLPHFESGQPVALDIWLRRAPVVLANLQLGQRKLVLARGRVRDSGMGEEGLCRTQALVELEGDLDAFLRETGNHHVVCYEDIYDELARLGRRLGLEVLAF